MGYFQQSHITFLQVVVQRDVITVPCAVQCTCRVDRCIVSWFIGICLPETIIQLIAAAIHIRKIRYSRLPIVGRTQCHILDLCCHLVDIIGCAAPQLQLNRGWTDTKLVVVIIPVLLHEYRNIRNFLTCKGRCITSFYI